VPTLVDSNILIDIAQDDSVWGDWSQSKIEAAIMVDDVFINPIIYAELSVAYASPADLDYFLKSFTDGMEEIPRAALFMAGRAFREYRKRKGGKTGVLPDFFIGAHAAVKNYSLLTRDPNRIRTYFPGVNIVAPLTL
jgi:predicted nucleic acid-binding protein